MSQLTLLNKDMKLRKRKETILTSIKQKVWTRDCHKSDNRVAQCATCEHIVRAPQSLIKSLKIKDTLISPSELYECRGVGEFGHIISEYNGGKATLSNLRIQCKKCNTSLGSDNIKIRKLDVVMLDSDEINTSPMEVDYYNETCNHNVKDRKCKNKPLKNREFCHIHLKQ
jgi:hypothetical protein